MQVPRGLEEVAPGAVEAVVDDGGRGPDGAGLVGRVGQACVLVQEAGLGDGFAEIGQGLSERACRPGQGPDLAPCGGRWLASGPVRGPAVEGVFGCEEGEQAADGADVVFQQVADAGAGTRQGGQRQLVGCLMDLVRQAVEMGGVVEAEVQRESLWAVVNRAAQRLGPDLGAGAAGVGRWPGTAAVP